ncbi:hypothetical protein GIB67_014648 [Kingdonia uniflora]|uniref:Uncharacterized protein n=1 Tax=Kingdonia uniflora TaxID=39325 RepID=A0A7J7LY26_9MAGN|nr:hypothetical protein GIB67_014648 [Kingdonia uniflora]
MTASINQISISIPKSKPQPAHSLILLPLQDTLLTRRNAVFSSGASLVVIISTLSSAPLPTRAEEDIQGVIGSLQSLLDPNEKTKSGKVLPKAYLKSAGEVVKTLRESLKENPKDNAKFRRSADAAKESIRGYLSEWRGQVKVAGEESYAAIERAIRALASFYSKAGPSAALPEEVKSNILNDLNTAESYL